MPTLHERLLGGLFGLLIGDALGVPYEFHQPSELPPPQDIEFDPPTEFRCAHAGVPPGTWSDDGAQALALLASLLERDQLVLQDVGRRLIAWHESGYLAVDGRVFDVGVQTNQAIRRLIAGIPAEQSGSTDEHANGNGSLMRALPLALWHRGDDASLVADAQRQSLVTHGHLRSQVCCALYCLWARRTMQSVADPWSAAVATLRAIYGSTSPGYAELEGSIRPDDPAEGRGTGYVVDCLRSARWAVQAGTYEQVVKAAIGLGHDTDTTACVAGGIAGLRDGVDAIPERWRSALRGQELVRPLAERLLQRQAIAISTHIVTPRPTAEECSSYYFTYIRLVPDGDIVQTLQTQHAEIHALLKSVSEAQAATAPAPGEWSIKQVLAHLSDTERLFAFRALWFARGEQAELPGMEPNPWVENSDSNARSLRDLLAEFDHVRAASVALFANLDAAAWERRGIASGNVMSVRALAWIIAGHELHHNRSLREDYL
jgi:ADP-ribosyl-[dinitrogen reductase] hydrolase